VLTGYSGTTFTFKTAGHLTNVFGRYAVIGWISSWEGVNQDPFWSKIELWTEFDIETKKFKAADGDEQITCYNFPEADMIGFNGYYYLEVDKSASSNPTNSRIFVPHVDYRARFQQWFIKQTEYGAGLLSPCEQLSIEVSPIREAVSIITNFHAG